MINQYIYGMKGLQSDQFTTIIGWNYVIQSTKTSKSSKYLFLFKWRWSFSSKILSIKVTFKSLLLLVSSKFKVVADASFVWSLYTFRYLYKKILSEITMVLPLSILRIIIILFLEKCLKALNLDAANFPSGLRSLEKLL